MRRMAKPLLIVACQLALVAVASFITAIFYIGADTGETLSDVGNAVMLTACFLSLLALHIRRPPPGD